MVSFYDICAENPYFPVNNLEVTIFFYSFAAV